ncbi:Pentatricopeptide repeat-containing protein At1g01970 [Linum grandiflorum]
MASSILRFPTLALNLKSQIPSNCEVHRYCTSKLSTGSLPCELKHAAQFVVQVRAVKGENPRSKWKEVGPNITKLQKQAISQISPVMTNRSRAVMKQLICFSDEKWSLAELLTTWVDIMKPTRADWLSVLKQLLETEHPFYIQVVEFALPEESFEANIRDYTKLIHYYGKKQQLEDAERIFSSMKERGLVYDQVTVTAMVHMYSKAGYHNKAEETFRQLTELGEPLDHRSYSSMVMSYIRAQMPHEAESLLKKMDYQQIPAGREVHKALLRTYSMAGDAEGAQRAFDAMQMAGVVPDDRICALLINAYGLAGESQNACIAFENMRRAGIEPTDKCVALVVGAFEKEKKLNQALEFLAGLEKDGVMVGKEASAILAGWFGKLGVVKEVERVLSEYENACKQVHAAESCVLR